MFTADLDLTQFRQRRAQTMAAMREIKQRAVEKATRAGRDEARAGDFKDKTGELRRTIQITGFSQSGNTYWGEYRTQKPYALFVEEPTQPHWIFPKAGYNAPAGSLMPGQTRRARGKGPHEHIVGRGQALRWKDEGGEHFARQVYHPGTAGFHFMKRSEAHARNVLRDELIAGFVNLRSVWA